MNSRNIGAKFELLKKSFLYFFPGCKYDWKNSQGLFNCDDRCVTKRSFVFSVEPVSFGSRVCSEVGSNLSQLPATFWGVCGVESTRVNRPSEDTFLLCFRDDNKHFTAYAVVSFFIGPNESIRLGRFDPTEDTLERLLVMMKKEREEYSEERWKRLREGRNNNNNKSKAEFEPPCKVGCLGETSFYQAPESQCNTYNACDSKENGYYQEYQQTESISYPKGNDELFPSSEGFSDFLSSNPLALTGLEPGVDGSDKGLPFFEGMVPDLFESGGFDPCLPEHEQLFGSEAQTFCYFFH